MKYKLQILLLAIAVNLFSQSYSDEEINQLSFEQKYQELKDANCDPLPSNAYCKLNKQKGNSKIEKLDFFKVDDSFLSQLADEIIIINEDHLFPQNRIFIHRLIRHFVKDTNVYFFFEALKPNRDILKLHIDTLNIGPHCGYYLKEPQMAENIRFITKQNNRPVFSYEAYQNSFDVKKYRRLGLDTKVSYGLYEMFLKTISKKDDIYASMSIRDMNQFINFYEKYKKIKDINSNARFVIFCGHGHIAENRDARYTDISWFNFAYLLKKYQDIDPLTIELTNLTDKCAFNQNKYYSFICNKYGNDDFLYTTVDSVIRHRLYMPLFEGE